MRGYHIRIIVSLKKDSPDTTVPPSFFQHLPSHKPNSTSRRNATFNPWNKDYRFGPIRLDWSDRMSVSTSNAVGKEKAHSHGESHLVLCCVFPQVLVDIVVQDPQ